MWSTNCRWERKLFFHPDNFHIGKHRAGTAPTSVVPRQGRKFYFIGNLLQGLTGSSLKHLARLSIVPCVEMLLGEQDWQAPPTHFHLRWRPAVSLCSSTSSLSPEALASLLLLCWSSCWWLVLMTATHRPCHPKQDLQIPDPWPLEETVLTASFC